MPVPNNLPGLQRIRGIYYYQPPKRDGVRPIRISLRTRDPGEAIDRYHAQLAADPAPEPIDRNARITTTLKAYLADKRARGSHRSAISGQAATTAIGHLVALHGDLRSANLTESHILALRAQLAARLSRETLHSYLRAIHAFAAWCRRRRMLSSDPFAHIDIPQPQRRGSVRYITRPERDNLIAKCRRRDLHTVLVLGFHCGLRIAEIIEARAGWVQFTEKRGVLTVRSTPTFRIKNDTPRLVPLDHTAAAWLRTITKKLRPDAYLVMPDKAPGKHRLRWDPRRTFKTHARRCGLAGLTMHDMRHTFASLHAQAGTPLFKVARWLGDTVSTVERHYADLSPHDTDIHRTVDHFNETKCGRKPSKIRAQPHGGEIRPS
jgi:integrase